MLNDHSDHKLNYFPSARAAHQQRSMAASRLSLLVLLAIWRCAASAASSPAPRTSSVAYSMSVQLPEDASCASLTRAKTTRLASSLAGALNMRPLPPARLVRPPGVALAGCRRTAYGFYATWTLRLVGTDMDAYATEFRAINLPRDTSVRTLCSWLDVFCKTAADVGLPVRGVWNEDSAVPVNFQNAIPLGWGGENAGKKMLLPVTFGSQQQPFTVVLDTGSSVPYVSYLYNSSATFANTSQPGSLEYGGAGNVTGWYATDRVAIGGITSAKLDFLLRTNVPDNAYTAGGGLFGFALLGYKYPDATVPASNSTSTWKQLSRILGLAGTPNNRVGLWLSNNQELLKGATPFGGELTLGTLNPARYTGAPVTLPVVPANSSVRTDAVNGELVWWQFIIERMSLVYGGDRPDYVICERCNAIADSGWPYIVTVNETKADVILRSMDGRGDACAWQLMLDFGTAGVLRMNLTRDGLPPVNPECSTNLRGVFTGFPQLNGLAPGEDNWYILGLPFLRQFFSVFDYTKLQVSFYISKQGFCG